MLELEFTPLNSENQTRDPPRGSSFLWPGAVRQFTLCTSKLFGSAGKSIPKRGSRRGPTGPADHITAPIDVERKLRRSPSGEDGMGAGICPFVLNSLAASVFVGTRSPRLRLILSAAQRRIEGWLEPTHCRHNRISERSPPFAYMIARQASHARALGMERKSIVDHRAALARIFPHNPRAHKRMARRPFRRCGEANRGRVIL